MNREDYLKDYYKTLEEAPYDVLEEYEGNILAALDDYKAIGDEKKSKNLKRIFRWVPECWNFSFFWFPAYFPSRRQTVLWKT